MKKKLLEFLLGWLQKKLSVSKTEKPELPYNSLSPIGNADIENDYGKALDWALSERENLDIKNIALTGPYGSGKSSILKTYQKNCKIEGLKFLSISLATFKEEGTDHPTKKEGVETGGPAMDTQSNGITPKEDVLRLIELSILQQIFYHEKDSKIPDSRFRKIKRYKWQNLAVSALVIFLLLLSVLQLIFPELFEFVLKVKLGERSLNWIHYTAVVIATVAGVTLIYKSIRIVNGVKISKLNIQNAEIEIDKSVGKSILNHHIDEILYFFEVTDNNVVIIEDLDRFKQTEIFTKLREINLLINSSKKIGKHVVFIYAVRDEMFKEKSERTKFFDFIIPVIPIINPSNSGQKFLEKQALYNYNISENLIDSISLFVDDMRLVHNIWNEFYLYRQKLNDTLSPDKLLAIIVYKNIFPYDFTLLSQDDGILFNSINNKQAYIKQELQSLDQRVQVIKAEIAELEKLKLLDIKELRYLYLLFYVSHLDAFISFYANGQDKTMEQMAEDSNFEMLISGKTKHKFHQGYSSHYKDIATKLSDVEKQVDPVKTYDERKKQIEEWNMVRLIY
jgi:hypothetical protein